MAANGSTDQDVRKVKKRSGLGRKFQVLLESVGKRDKTEYTEDYSTSLKAVDEHDKTVEHLLDGYARVIQPDSRLRKDGMSPKPSTEQYDDLVKALTNAQTTTMNDSPMMSGYITLVTGAYTQIADDQKKWQLKMTESCTQFVRFRGVYVRSVLADKDELEKRRVDMDSAKAKVKSSTDLQKMEGRAAEFAATTKEFEAQADKLLQLTDLLPGKKEDQCVTMCKLMTAELHFHESAANTLRKAIADCKATGMGRIVALPTPVVKEAAEKSTMTASATASATTSFKKM